MPTTTPHIEPLGLLANQWQFLNRPKEYVEASQVGSKVGAQGRPLDPNCTPRQFNTARDILERLNGSRGQTQRRGVLLADDVGLGKTTVAALVAWVVASAGVKRQVRILVPNDVMRRRWVKELESHVPLLKKCARALGVHKDRIKDGKLPRSHGKVAPLRAGCIQVVNHSYVTKKFDRRLNLPLNCDLLIIDEAHRARGESSAFSQAIRRQKKAAKRVLILTATPFSIQLAELQNMLSLIGGESANEAVAGYRKALDALYQGNATRGVDVAAKDLTEKATAVVDAIRMYVIRHGVDDLPKEKKAFGDWKVWPIKVAPANSAELELMLRMDRALRVANGAGATSSKATNDARFHVGWQHLDERRDVLKDDMPQLSQPAAQIVKQHLKAIASLRGKCPVHPKMDAVAKEVSDKVDPRGKGHSSEKVLLFCHHHATAQELTKRIHRELPALVAPDAFSPEIWKQAWQELWARLTGEDPNEKHLNSFIDWLCADMIRAQTWSWLSPKPKNRADLQSALESRKGRSPAGNETIAKAAQRLYTALVTSKSSRAVLSEATNDFGKLSLPGSNGTSRVLGVCDPGTDQETRHLFMHNNQPDTVISIFNSPFGPDVLVATDKLSEGVDLHRYCRHLIHYELDPSPIRTVQRNGRLRRVDNWAAAVNQPILFAYPAWEGTRDHRLVQIMKKRVESFSLLLGGVQDIDVDGDAGAGADETWRSDVIERAKKVLIQQSGKLCASKFEGN